MSRCLACLLLLTSCTSWADRTRDVEVRCPPPLAPLSGDTCVALPPAPADGAPVIVFLHGMAPTPELALGVAADLGRAAVAKGVTLVAPLGTQGLCGWSPEAAQAWCWPTHPERQVQPLHELGARLRAELEEVSRRLGRRGLRVVLAGHSNGGFAAALLTATGEFRPAGLAVLHAGGDYRWSPDLAVPTLLRTGAGDPWHHATMVTLHERLAAAGWPADWQQQEGGHDLTWSDVVALVDFAAEAGTSRLANRPAPSGQPCSPTPATPP